MSSLYTIVAMAAIRYRSIVRYERSWHLETNVLFFTSHYVKLIWIFAFLMGIPPLVGVGKYVTDIGMVR